MGALFTASTNWNSRFGNILEENCDYPDLQVTGIVLPDSIVSCSDLQVLATITNEGTYRVRTNGWYDELYISHLPTFDSSAIRLARMRHNNASNMLQPDSSYTVTFLGQIPHLWIGETYFYIATAVGFDETELDTTNNVTTSVMRTVLLPDIVHPDIVVWDTACVQYTWNGHTYDTSGLYTYVHEYDDSPCHNTDTLHLKIRSRYLYTHLVNQKFRFFFIFVLRKISKQSSKQDKNLFHNRTDNIFIFQFYKSSRFA